MTYIVYRNDSAISRGLRSDGSFEEEQQEVSNGAEVSVELFVYIELKANGQKYPNTSINTQLL